MDAAISAGAMDDPGRRAEVQQAIDSAGRDQFTRLMGLACAATSSPMGLVSLVQPGCDTYVAHAGLPAEWNDAREMYTASSLCGEVVRRGSPLVLADVPASPEGAGCSAAERLGVGAYLGVPIFGRGPYPLGALCVMFPGAHAWSDQDLEYLTELGRLVSTDIERCLDKREGDTGAPAPAQHEALLVENVADAVIVTDLERRVTRWNRGAEMIFGYTASEAIGQHGSFLHPQDEAEFIWDDISSSLEAEGRWSGEIPFLRKDGTRGICECILLNMRGQGEDIAYRLGISRDVTERRRIHAAMIQSQKMEGLGQLAGGLSHDFNNLLSSILGGVSLLRISETGYSEDDMENLDTIESAARRGADITGRLLSFARGELARLSRTDLRDVVNDALRLSRSSIPGAIAVDVSVPGAPVVVEGDAAQLQQALINIILNACYVMPDGGDLRLSVDIEGEDGRIHITDTGPGMDAATRARLFEPFFTTKPHGLGTGLGLPSTYGIITSHRGTIDVQSAPGEGSTFTICLPVVAGDAQADAAPAAVPHGAVLIVDDDQIVRRAMRSMLESIGLVTVEASDGEAALALVREDPGRWAVVLLDLVMPGATGVEVFRELASVRQDLPVVVASGYAPDRFLEDEDRRRISAVLQKPFTLDRLRSTLESVGVSIPAAKERRRG